MLKRHRRYLAIALLTLAVEALLAFILFASVRHSPSRPEGEAGLEDAAEEGPAATVVYDKMPTILVNPAGSSGERFLVVELELLLESNDVESQLQKERSRIRDDIHTRLNRKTWEQMDEGFEQDALQKDLTAAINRHLPDGGVTDVLFRTFLVR